MASLSCPYGNGSSISPKPSSHMTATITLNGHQFPLAQITTIGELLAHHGLQEQRTIVQINEEVIGDEGRDKHPVLDGDVVEIVHFVGGGSVLWYT